MQMSDVVILIRYSYFFLQTGLSIERVKDVEFLSNSMAAIMP